MRKYEFDVSGDNWAWSDRIDAACVSDAVKEVASVLSDLLSPGEHEVDVSVGDLLVFTDSRKISWYINDQECEIDGFSLDASECDYWEVKVVKRVDFEEPDAS